MASFLRERIPKLGYRRHPAPHGVITMRSMVPTVAGRRRTRNSIRELLELDAPEKDFGAG
jgi:hypothetical protein